HNDPAFGGSHAIDVCMYKPVFYKGKLRYWTVCKGHLTDIGGRYRPATIRTRPKSMPSACAFRRSKFGTAASRATMLSTSSSPTCGRAATRRATSMPLIGACQVGERNLLGMIEKYWIDETDACIGELLDMADRHMRSLIKAVPDGVYQGTAILEDA